MIAWMVKYCWLSMVLVSLANLSKTLSKRSLIVSIREFLAKNLHLTLHPKKVIIRKLSQDSFIKSQVSKSQWPKRTSAGPPRRHRRCPCRSGSRHGGRSRKSHQQLSFRLDTTLGSMYRSSDSH